MTVPYSYFLSQVQSSNVASVTARGRGHSGNAAPRDQVPGAEPTTATLFKTQPPRVPDDDLLGELLRNGAAVNAKRSKPGSRHG